MDGQPKRSVSLCVRVAHPPVYQRRRCVRCRDGLTGRCVRCGVRCNAMRCAMRLIVSSKCMDHECAALRCEWDVSCSKRRVCWAVTLPVGRFGSSLVALLAARASFRQPCNCTLRCRSRLAASSVRCFVCLLARFSFARSFVRSFGSFSPSRPFADDRAVLRVLFLCFTSRCRVSAGF